MPTSEAERDRVIQTLCSHYASDHLTTEELESRIEQAYRAASPADLAALLSNLPALRDADVTPTRPGRAISARADEAPDEKRITTVMSETVKRGTWAPARSNKVRAIMSSVTLDLREAILYPGETEFAIRAIMAEVRIIVPPGLPVSCDGHAIMAEFKEYNSAAPQTPNAPSVRIHGTAIMASVTIEARLLGETGRDARRRLRATSDSR